MMKALCSFMFMNHEKCKHEIHQLSVTNRGLLTQIEELKAINDYQCTILERKVNDLEEENRLLKEKIEARKKKRAEKLKAKREKKEN